MTGTVLDFLKTAKHPTLMIIGVSVIICLGELLFWVETSRKDTKFWGIEIMVPESDAIKACRALQAAFHERALGLENERKATYRLMENDEASIDAFTKLQLEAKARDKDTVAHENENAVIWRINNLVNDSNSREQRVKWLNETEAYDTERVNQECGSLLIARSG
jgi:hypothetical protein